MARSAERKAPSCTRQAAADSVVAIEVAGAPAAAVVARVGLQLGELAHGERLVVAPGDHDRRHGRDLVPDVTDAILGQDRLAVDPGDGILGPVTSEEDESWMVILSFWQYLSAKDAPAMQDKD